MVFRNNSLAQHARILVFALAVDGDVVLRNKVVLRVDDPSMCIQTVALVIHEVSHHIQATADGNRNVRSFCKELKQEADQLETSIVILPGNNGPGLSPANSRR